jgi:hypothetical protein
MNFRRSTVTCVLLCFFCLSVVNPFNKRKWDFASLQEAYDAPKAENTLKELQLAPVFYNLFVSKASDSDRVTGLVEDQLSHLLPEHRLYVHSIGYPLAIPNVTLLTQNEKGDEIDTLHSLWAFCIMQPSSKVVYLHSKGSFHPKPENEVLRPFLTSGALSRECLELPKSCNVCSSRMSPIPHP